MNLLVQRAINSSREFVWVDEYGRQTEFSQETLIFGLVLGLLLFLANIILFVWLVSRTSPERRLWWFLGCVTVTMLISKDALIGGFLKIAISSLVLLIRQRRQGQNYFLDIRKGFEKNLSSLVS